MTAVTGCKAPRIEVNVGPIRLIAFTPVKLDIIVDQRLKPRIYSQLFPSGIIVRLPSNMNAQAMK